MTCPPRNRLALAALVTLALAGLPPAAQESPRKVPVPEEAALKRARGLVDEIFGRDLKAALTPAERLKLAGTFAQQARENRDEPANRFVLLEQALQLAARAGDLHLALTLLDELARDFDLDPLERKARLLADAAAAELTPESARTLVELTLPLLQEAVEADQYPAAQAFGKIAQRAAARTQDEAVARMVRRRVEEGDAVREGYERLQGAIDRLKADPNDPQANLELGRYQALLKNRWDRALPLLAMGGDAGLRELARRDLARPPSAADQVALADAWWERSLAEKEPARLALQARAAHWYEQAVPHLAGLNRTKAARRVDRVAALRSSSPDGPAGPVGELKKLTGHSDEVKAVALSPDGRFALSGGLDQIARLWDLGTGKEERAFRGHTKQLWAVAFHPNGRTGFTSSWDGTVREWDLRGGAESRRFRHRLDVNGIALSRGGELLLTGSDDHHAYLWDTAAGDELRRFAGHTGFVYAVAFSPDGKQIATGSVDKTVRLHELHGGGTTRTLEGHTNPVSGLAYSPDGRFLFSCGDGQPRQWELGGGQEVRRFRGHTGYALCLALSPDGRRLATGGDDKTIRLWDTASGKEVHTFQGHEGTVTALAFAADGRRLLSGSSDRTVRLWGLPAR